MNFPVEVWGAVDSGGDAGEVTAVRVEPGPAGSFLVLTREARGEFDVWLEDARAVEAYLAEFRVRWPE